MRAQRKLIGKTYGLLKVVEYAGKTTFSNSVWNCVCKCGREKKEVLYQGLEYGKVRSCGQCDLKVPPYKPKERKYRMVKRRSKSNDAK